MTNEELIAIARRAKGSDLLPKVSFGTMNAETLILRLAQRLEKAAENLNDLAADRIEELEAKLAKAVIGLKDVIGVLDDPTGDEHVRDMRAATMIARTTIAELTGGKDE